MTERPNLPESSDDAARRTAREADRAEVRDAGPRDPAIAAERARRRRHEERAAQRRRERSEPPRSRPDRGAAEEPSARPPRRGTLRAGLLATLLACTATLLWLQRDAVAQAIGDFGALPGAAIGRALDRPAVGSGATTTSSGARAGASAGETIPRGGVVASPSLEPTVARRAWGTLRSRAFGPPRIGVQIGHADAHLHPDELADLRVSTGGRAGDLFEVDVNRAVGTALSTRLEAAGLRVDLLPATVPPGYRADAVISIHADSSSDRDRRGYKSAVFEATATAADRRLKSAVDRAYVATTRLPDDDANVTSNMFAYYAFNPRFEHAIARRTPALLVELGYISNPHDRVWLDRPDALADALATGIGRFLHAQGRPEGERLLAVLDPDDAGPARD